MHVSYNYSFTFAAVKSSRPNQHGRKYAGGLALFGGKVLGAFSY
jgi:hypothetical protein